MMYDRHDADKIYFDPEKAISGQAFTSDYLVRNRGKDTGFKSSYVRFVCLYQDDPIFEYVDFLRWPNGVPKGGTAQKFSLFCTHSLYRDPENDWVEDESE